MGSLLAFCPLDFLGDSQFEQTKLRTKSLKSKLGHKLAGGGVRRTKGENIWHFESANQLSETGPSKERHCQHACKRRACPVTPYQRSEDDNF